jgi:hypothetical protein
MTDDEIDPELRGIDWSYLPWKPKPPSQESLKPWLAEGVGRTTWFKRRKAAQQKERK